MTKNTERQLKNMASKLRYWAKKFNKEVHISKKDGYLEVNGLHFIGYKPCYGDFVYEHINGTYERRASFFAVNF